MKGLSGRIAIVTGASGLIGRAVVRRLLSEGAHVAGVCRTPPFDMGEERFLGVSLDLSSELSIRDGLNQVCATFGIPTILIAAATGRPPTSGGQLTDPSFESLFAVDVAGHLKLAEEMVKRLPSRSHGSIVWLSSIYADHAVDVSIYPDGMRPTPMTYGAIKAAVHNAVKQLAVRWGPRNVRVNAVVAGGVRSPDRQPEEFVIRYSAKTAIGRMATADEIASVAAFLASDDATYVTGVALPTDGGFDLC